jgi:hypothetical protein
LDHCKVPKDHRHLDSLLMREGALQDKMNGKKQLLEQR